MKPEKQSYETAGAPLVVTALKIFGYSVLAGVMGLFLYFSMTMLSNGLFQEPSVYRIAEVNSETGETTYTDIPYEEYQAMDPDEFQVEGEDRKAGEVIMAPKNALCDALLTASQVLTQALMLGIFVCMAGYYVWIEGDRDRNLQDHHGRTSTPLRGLWIGLLAAIPSLATYAVLLLCAMNVVTVNGFVGIYRLLNATFLPMMAVIIPTDVVSATELTAVQLAGAGLLLLILPITCVTAYLLGNFRVLKNLKK